MLVSTQQTFSLLWVQVNSSSTYRETSLLALCPHLTSVCTFKCFSGGLFLAFDQKEKKDMIVCQDKRLSHQKNVFQNEGTIYNVSISCPQLIKLYLQKYKPFIWMKQWQRKWHFVWGGSKLFRLRTTLFSCGQTNTWPRAACCPTNKDKIWKNRGYCFITLTFELDISKQVWAVHNKSHVSISLSSAF